MGDVNNGAHNVGLGIDVDIPDDDTTVVFSYLILNNGHGGNDAKAKAAQAALSTIAKEVIAHKAISGAVLVGAVLVPLFGTAVAAVAAVMGAIEAGLILFADCDGPVAHATLAFSCSDLINRTGSGQKISDNTHHPGVDSPTGCGSNSSYTTSCTIGTTVATQTVIDVTGAWVETPGPFISRVGNSLTVDMSYAKRPTATGTMLNASQISVHFPDDQTYTGTLQAPGTIAWSNNASWSRIAAIQTAFDLNGKWMAGGVLGPVFTVHGNSISVDMSALNRPTATGNVVSASEISVTFPDDRTYAGTLRAPGTITWSNNTSWAKFNTSPIKHLFVLVMENRSFDHMLGFQGITGNDAQTGAPTKADDLSGIPAPTNDFGKFRYAVSSTAGDTTLGKHDVNHQFTDVLAQLCGETEAQAVAKNPKGLNGGAYPPVLAPAATGFAADYGLHSDSGNPGEPMRGFGPGQLPVLTALAKEFVLCDHWYSSIPGPTEPNRMFVHAATSDWWDDSPTNTDYEVIFGGKSAGVTSDGISFEHGNIFDALRRAKVPFRIYTGDGFPQVGLLKGISIYDDIDDYANFAADILEPNYDAAYTFIEPRYDTISQQLGLSFVNNSQHPANSVELGEALIKNVYETIRNSPRWAQSMLIITWDEHGGFFDHKTPPVAEPIPSSSPPGHIVGKDNGFIFDRLGVRVPAVVISPWCPQNLIDHQQREHSNIPATIEQLFGLGPLTNRDAAAVGLQTLATLSAPRNVTLTLPNPKTVPEPDGPVQGAPVPGTGPVATSAVVAAPRPKPPPTAATPLDLKDPWVASALAVAAKAHAEAAPTEAANIKARVFGAKTVGDLDAYVKDMTPVVNNARAAARTRKVAARKPPVAGPVLTGPVVTGPVLTGQVGGTTVGTIVRDHEPIPHSPEPITREGRPPLRTP